MCVTNVIQQKEPFFTPGFWFLLQLHMAEHPAGHLVLKWLIEQDMTLAEAGKEGTFSGRHEQGSVSML